MKNLLNYYLLLLRYRNDEKEWFVPPDAEFLYFKAHSTIVYRNTIVKAILNYFNSIITSAPLESKQHVFNQKCIVRTDVPALGEVAGWFLLCGEAQAR